MNSSMEVSSGSVGIDRRKVVRPKVVGPVGGVILIELRMPFW